MLRNYRAGGTTHPPLRSLLRGAEVLGKHIRAMQPAQRTPRLKARPMTKYVKWKHRRRGFPDAKGHARTCMHCKRRATEMALRKQGHFEMFVWFCDEHRETATNLE
jgi:hypothetical protein